MALMNLAQAKDAAGAKKDVRYIYNGPGSWPVAADSAVSPNPDAPLQVKAPKMSQAPLPTKPEAPAPKAASATPPYTVPMFVPMDKDKGLGAKDKYKGEGRPMHMANLDTRGHFLGWNFGFGYKNINDSDSYTGIYSNYFWSAVCLVLTIVTYFVHPYVACIFAYLYGHYWSEYLFGNAWGIAWLKGKSLIAAY